MQNAPTEFGNVSAVMSFGANGADVSIKADFHDAPKQLRIRIPWFKRLTSFTTDARQSQRDGDSILLSPGVTKLSINWQDKPDTNIHTVEDILTDYRSANSFDGADPTGHAIVTSHQTFLNDDEKSNLPQPLSFDWVRKTFLLEYQRRAGEAVKNGNKLIKISAPAMLTADQRKVEFGKLFGSH